MSTVLSYRFKYEGSIRHVDNVQYQNSVINGFEVRKAGKFSNKIKSYRLDKIESTLERIEIDRPNRPEAPAQDAILVTQHARMGDVIKG